MAGGREEQLQLASKDADNPSSGAGDSKQNYEHEFPSLTPTSEPDVNRSDVDGKTLNGDDKDGGRHDGKDSDDGGVRSPALQMNGQNRSPSGTLQTGTTLAGSLTRGPGSLSFAAAGVDGNIDSSSSELWDPPGIRGRVAKRKRYNNPSPPSKRSANGIISSHRHWRGSPVSFGDDLDERSETEEEEFGSSGDGDNEEATGWKIRLAPWNTPMHRRLQTLVVLMHCLGMGLTFSLFCFLCTIPLLWPILIAYLIYIRFSTAGTDGITTHRFDAFRKARVWRYFAAYYPASLHKTADLPPTRKYILAVHPHGIISHGAWAAFATEALGFSQLFPGITNSLCTLNGNFKTPFYREYLLAMGLQSVSRESITNLLTKGGANGEGMGRAVSIVIGGAREALEAQPKTMRLIVSRRGFCRMALRTGADLVPVLAFGENDLYRQWSQRDHPKFRRLQMKFLALMGFSVPVLQGRGVFNYDFGFLPHRRPLNIVVGAPIKVRQFTGSSREEEAAAIDALHKVYLEKLVELYDEYKDVYFKDRKEEIQFVV